MFDLIQFVAALDRQLFMFINVDLANAILDFLMPIITNKKNWYLPIAISWILMIWKGGKKGRIVALLLIPVLILSDQASSSWLKPAFGRLRPCKVLENINLLVRCGSGYSFPSSHATNISAAFTLFIYFYRKYTVIWIAIILLVGLSRIYVGVHYPMDVLGGFAVGTIISITIILLFNNLEDKLKRFVDNRRQKEPPDEQGIR
jgi:undecaprenyl-diphosphatase